MAILSSIHLLSSTLCFMVMKVNANLIPLGKITMKHVQQRNNLSEYMCTTKLFKNNITCISISLANTNNKKKNLKLKKSHAVYEQ